MSAVTLDWKELARRSANGLDVRLVWSRSADRVQVVVTDRLLDDRFELEVDKGDALDAFHHPFAYVPLPERVGPKKPVADYGALGADGAARRRRCRRVRACAAAASF